MPATHRGMSLRVLIVAALAFILAGCAPAQSSQQSEGDSGSQAESATEATHKVVTTEGLKQSDTLTVGLRIDRGAPYVTEHDSDESESAIQGLDVELGCALADELGLAVSLKSVNNVNDALTNTCDVVINVTAEEAQGFDVVGNYAQDATAFFHKGEATVVNVDNINGKTIGLQESSSAQTSLHLTALDVTERTFSTVSEAFDALAEGEVDYVLCAASSGAYLSTLHENISFAGAINEPTAQGIGIASGEGSVQTSVRTAYEAIQKNGVLSEIRRSWLGSLPELTSESVIPNIPMRETSGDPLQSTTSAEVLNTALDGSTAGANAVTLSDVSAAGGSTSGVTSSSGSSSDYGGGGGYSSYSEYSSDYSGGSYTESYTDYGNSDTGYSDYSVSYDNTGTTDYGYAGDYTESYGY